MSNILFLGTQDDEAYLSYLKPSTQGHKVFLLLKEPSTFYEILLYCRKKEITSIITTSPKFLKILLEKKSGTLDDYVGSIFKKNDLDILICHPLAHFVKVKYGKFLIERYISKITKPNTWPTTPKFDYELLTPSNVEELFIIYKSAFLIACDIETYKENLAIRCIGYTAVFIDEDTGEIATHSTVLPIEDMWAVTWMRKFNWELQAPKIFQNGKYDISYLSRYNAVPYNYLLDTATLFHSWYSELPKALSVLSAFFIRESMYWKDMADTADLAEYYEYNARDTWATAIVAIEALLQMPEWATTNYLLEFPLLFPCHLAEMTGIKRDMVALTTTYKEQETINKTETASLNKMLGIKFPNEFNPGSSQQVKSLLVILGCKDIPSTEEKDLKKAALRHPLNSLIINKILDIRGARKLMSTYLVEGKEYKGRILYALNPHGTDTSRLASKEHHFWCGLPIQNIVRGPVVKQTLVADEDFLFAEVDLEQAESYDTGYIVGEDTVIAALNSDKDFHALNAEAFFGISYDKIYDDVTHKVLDKIIRDISKRTNHGANYCMGPNVLVDTMGEDKIRTAGNILKLSKLLSPKQIAEHLLEQFHRRYPKISRVYYPAVITEVNLTNRLTSKAMHHCEYQVTIKGWTRYCFGKPDKNKHDMNSYAAHCPQSLNAQTLNKAWMLVFYKIAMHPVHGKNFKLIAQIHDSILFQFRKGHEYLCLEVKECMEIPIRITGYDGKTRDFIVPAAIKAGQDGKGVTHWSLTE